MEKVDQIVKCLAEGGAVLLPTDTVYGLAAKPTIDSAVAKIFELKSRPRNQFLPIMVSSEDELAGLGLDINVNADKLLKSSLIPGAVTIILGFNDAGERPDWLKDREETAIRIPDDAVLLEVLRQTGPLLVTSANKHQSPGTPNNVAEILLQLSGKPDFVLDGGIKQEIPSTIINCRVELPSIQRLGCVPETDIFNVINNG